MFIAQLAAAPAEGVKVRVFKPLICKHRGTVRRGEAKLRQAQGREEVPCRPGVLGSLGIIPGELANGRKTHRGKCQPDA